MLRFVVILLAAVLLISVLRSVIGLILRGFAELVNSPGAASQSKRPEVPVSGELKKDPVCGTFVPVSSAVKTVSGAQTVYFCSEECKSKYHT